MKTILVKNQKKWRETGLDILGDFAGALLQAIGVWCFIEPSRIAPGGVSGIALMINHLFGLPIGALSLALNIPLLLASWLLLNRGMTLKTIRTVICMSVIQDLVSAFCPWQYAGDRLVSCAFGGIFVGVGLALIFMRNSTSGGGDILAKLLQKRFPYMQTGYAIMLVDFVIVTISVLVFGEIEAALYGIISIVCTTQSMDALLYGLNRGSLITIHSAKNEDIAHEIMETMDRGTTFYKSIGGFSAKYTFSSIIGRSEPMQRMIQTSKKAAQNDSNVLILGESGTGKELIAQSIHNASPVAGGPFVAINCAAIPNSLVESELFGYEKGTFTGAEKEGRPGKFEMADGGTIFLDEIGDMPYAVQAALLRVLQTKEVVRVGGKYPKPVNIRVIAATNQDLTEAVAQKTFREDLFYRLNVLTIAVPPLRDRGADDISLLISHFVDMYNKKRHTDITVAPQVYQVLRNYSWPGNVRQLENTVERAISLCSDDMITCEDLPPQFCDMIAAQSNGSADAAYANSEHPGYPGNGMTTAGSMDYSDSERIDYSGHPSAASHGTAADAHAHAAQHYNSAAHSAPQAEAGSYVNESIGTGTNPDPHRESYNIAENEAALIISALEKCSGNVTAAAKLLSMNLRTLYRKIKKHQIDVDLYRHRK